ncbi:hypothetical protein L1987_39790 [Smallanthus sonchifolius]|uniref:Uncharacterized protein n=1 Tax=Smallanthus sonchifolius TaxID=185202 RepID=A0ACB9HMR8_9ASTR|nr:hypothetical protein L1987_39790 [Smallanthus sonchifolius]
MRPTEGSEGPDTTRGVAVHGCGTTSASGDGRRLGGRPKAVVAERQADGGCARICHEEWTCEDGTMLYPR